MLIHWLDDQKYDWSSIKVSLHVSQMFKRSVMIESTRRIDEIYKSDMTMWYSKQAQNEYILW